MNYKRAILDILGKIHDDKILKRIYNFVRYLYIGAGK